MIGELTFKTYAFLQHESNENNNALGVHHKWLAPTCPMIAFASGTPFSGFSGIKQLDLRNLG